MVGSEVQAPAASPFPPGKETPEHIGEKAGPAPEPVWTLWGGVKSLTPGGNRISARNSDPQLS